MSSSHSIQVYRANLTSKVDCPGFDDSVRSDTEILREITETLSALYIVGLKLRGVIYLQRITDVRMQGSSMKNLQLFVKMVGKERLSNVVFATTMWGKVTPEDIEIANVRDSELREEYWADFINMGAQATRFEGSKASAEGILSILLGKKDVVLKVQNELVDARKSLRDTEVGEFLEPRVDLERNEFEDRIKALEAQLKAERDNGRRLDYKRRQRRAQAGKEQRQRDKQVLETKPGVEAEEKLERFKNGSLEVWKNALQALAAVVSISAGVAGIIMSVVC